MFLNAIEGIFLSLKTTVWPLKRDRWLIGSYDSFSPFLVHIPTNPQQKPF